MTQQLTPNLRNAHPQVSITVPALTAMPQFAVFFADGAGLGIVMVQSLNAAHPQDITRAQHPTGGLSAFPSELGEGEEPPQTAHVGSATGVEQRPPKELNEQPGCAVITARADQMTEA